MYENDIKLMGFVGKVDVYEGEGKKPFARVTLATHKLYKNSKGEYKQTEPAWHTLHLFGNMVEVVKKRVSKGSHLYVSGELDYSEREIDGKKLMNTFVSVKQLKLLDKNQKKDNETTSDWHHEYWEVV